MPNGGKLIAGVVNVKTCVTSAARAVVLDTVTLKPVPVPPIRYGELV